MKKHLNNIPTLKLRSILSENYTRGVNGKDYEHCKDELANVLWDREDRQREINTDKRLNAINNEMESFTSSFKVFKSRLKREGDTQQLREDIRVKQEEFTQFLNYTNRGCEVLVMNGGY